MGSDYIKSSINWKKFGNMYYTDNSYNNTWIIKQHSSGQIEDILKSIGLDKIESYLRKEKLKKIQSKI